MLEVRASEFVAAEPQAVWALLCDTSRYADWVAGTDGARVAFTPRGEPSLGPIGVIADRLMRGQAAKDNQRTVDAFARLVRSEQTAQSPA